MKNEELMRLLARRQKRNRKLLTAGRFLIGILFFAIWELCARFGIINDLFSAVRHASYAQYKALQPIIHCGFMFLLH